MASRVPAPISADNIMEVSFPMDWLYPVYKWVVFTLAIFTSVCFFLEQPSLENAFLALFMTLVFATIYALLLWPLAALAGLLVGLWNGIRGLGD